MTTVLKSVNSLFYLVFPLRGTTMVMLPLAVDTLPAPSYATTVYV